MNQLRQSAEELRSQGYSYALINKKLGVSKSTMSYWFKDMPFTPNKEVLDRIANGPAMTGINSHNRRVEEIKELRIKGLKEIGELSQRDLWMVGLGLYIGEGAKTQEHIRVINSDPAVIKLAIRWFEEICKIPKQNLTITLHIYPDLNEADCLIYWKKITGLTNENFRKTQVDRRLNKKLGKRGSLPYGTAHLRVASGGDREKGVRLSRRIRGWMDGVLRQVP